jgi:hypothetical protein
MGLFTSDLYRSFAMGFALGAAALFVTMGDVARTELAAKVVPSAYAATVR